MKYFEAVDKFKQQQKMIQSCVKCFEEEDSHGTELEELSAFLNAETKIKNIVVAQASSLYLMVNPKDYYLTSVVGAHYAKNHGLNNIKLVSPTGEKSSDLEAIIAFDSNQDILDKKVLEKIESFNQCQPF